MRFFTFQDFNIVFKKRYKMFVFIFLLLTTFFILANKSHSSIIITFISSVVFYCFPGTTDTFKLNYFIKVIISINNLFHFIF